MTPRDWTVPQNDALWQDGAKALFDPCPAGWRVPKSGAGGTGGSPWDSFGTDERTYANGCWSDDGRAGLWPVNGGTADYPVPGCRHSVANFVNVDHAGHNWSSTVTSEKEVYYFRLDPTRLDRSYAEIYRGFGFSVRCIRE